MNARIGAGGKLGLKFLNPASGVDVLQLAREERVASRANIDLQLLFGAAGLKRVAAATRYGGVNVGGVNAVLHGLLARASARVSFAP